MAFSAKRTELIAEIAELQRLQMGAKLKANLGGWTQQSEAWHEMRAARISLLRLELAALDKSLGLFAGLLGGFDGQRTR